MVMEMFDGHEQVNDVVPDEALSEVVLLLGNLLEGGTAELCLDVQVLSLFPCLHKAHTVRVFGQLLVFRHLLQFTDPVT